MLEPGSSFQWIPENVGEFPYFDMIHPWMQGTIIVQEATEKTKFLSKIIATKQLENPIKKYLIFIQN